MKTTVKSFASDVKTDDIIDTLKVWLTNDGYKCQTLDASEDSKLLQVYKPGGWRNFLGMSTSLNVLFTPVNGELSVEIGEGKWLDKVVVGTLSLLLLWPLIPFAAYGAYQQANLPNRIYRHVEAITGHTIFRDEK